MTNRRSFLGLLAATPFVVPVVAKEMAAPRYATGRLAFTKIFPHSYTPLEIDGRREILPRYGNVHNFRDWSCAYYDHYPFEGDRLDYTSAKIPNRLHGAYIKDDGDAV